MKKMKMLAVLFFAVVFVSGCSCTKSMCNKEDLNAIKESINNKWRNDAQYITRLEEEARAKDIVDEKEISDYVEQNLQKKIDGEYKSHPKACMTTIKMEDPDSGATISAKSWGDAFKKGLLEGLIVFPISWLFSTFASLFGGSGTAKVLSIVVTTVIIKLLMLAFTFKQQIQTQRMQAIQPELNAIMEKLKDQNLSQNEKIRLQMKMMETYKKYNINPIATLVPTLLSFPIFLSVWSAVTQTLVIRSGEFLGIELGKAVSTQVFGLDIGAIVLFIAMAALQILSMKMPEIIRKKYSKNKVQNEQGQMKTMMNVMIVMILFTGFMLPAALAVYWTIAALFSILQTIIFQNPKVKEKLSSIGNRKKKAKVVQ